MTTEEVLQHYLFHYNPFEKKWYGFKREDSNKYFTDKKTALSNKSMKKLIEGIVKN